MRLANKTIYGINIVYLVHKHGKLNTNELNEKINTSRAFIQNICRQLRLQGILDIETGVAGGSVLNKNAKDIKIKDICTALGEKIEINNKCSNNNALNKFMNDIQSEIDKYLNKSIADI